MPHPVRPLVGGAPPTPPRRTRITAAGGGRRPLLARMGLQVERPELVHADHHGRVTRSGRGLTFCDRVELEDAVLLRLVVWVGGGLPGLYRLKGDPLLAEKKAQALMADVVDHPLGQEVGQSASLARLQVENGRSWSVGRDSAIFLICCRCASVNVGGRPPA